MSDLKRINANTPFVKGETYKLVYDVDHIKLFGWDVPDALVPESVRQSIAKRQVQNMVTKLREDERFEVVGYEYSGNVFEITVLATDNPLPLGIIVGGIIALAIIFGIALVLSVAYQIVQAIGPTNVGIVAVVAGLLAWPFVSKGKFPGLKR